MANQERGAKAVEARERMEKGRMARANLIRLSKVCSWCGARPRGGTSVSPLTVRDVMESAGDSMFAGSRVAIRITQPRTTSRRLAGLDYLAPQSTSMQLQITWAIKAHFMPLRGCE